MLRGGQLFGGDGVSRLALDSGDGSAGLAEPDAVKEGDAG